MRKFVLFMLVMSVFLFGCTRQQEAQEVIEKTEDQGVALQETVVFIDGFKFDPAIVTIKPGTTVIWKNKDSASHTAKFADWESEELFQDDTAQRKFSTKGTYDYTCGLHPSMKGSVVVE